MQIAMIGTGYVGLVTGVCFSEFGFRVTCVDNDSDKIGRLQQQIMPIYEPGLEQMVDKNRKAGRLSFTTDLKNAVENADVVFIAVGTPTGKESDLPDTAALYAAAEELARYLKNYTVVVIKSTVPISSNRTVAGMIAKINPDADFDVVSNPEFLREGSAIEDFMAPDRVVVGLDSKRAREVMQKLYEPVCLGNIPLLFTTFESAEMIKYAANSMLAIRIAFIDQMADICEKVGANIRDVSKGIGLDKRIGDKFLQPGPGFGGSCFPKDTRALKQIAENAGAASSIVQATIDGNELRKRRMAAKILAAVDGGKDKTIAVLGLTFKPGTDDMREAASLTIIPELQKAGATVKAYDPQGMKEAATMLPGIIACANAEEAMKGADALVILTEWNEFRTLDLKQVKSHLKKPVVVDLRNIYRRQDMQKHGFHYVSIGRQDVVPGQPWISDLNIENEKVA